MLTLISHNARFLPFSSLLCSRKTCLLPPRAWTGFLCPTWNSSCPPASGSRCALWHAPVQYLVLTELYFFFYFNLTLTSTHRMASLGGILIHFQPACGILTPIYHLEINFDKTIQWHGKQMFSLKRGLFIYLFFTMEIIWSKVCRTFLWSHFRFSVPQCPLICNQYPMLRYLTAPLQVQLDSRANTKRKTQIYVERRKKHFTHSPRGAFLHRWRPVARTNKLIKHHGWTTDMVSKWTVGGWGLI